MRRGSSSEAKAIEKTKKPVILDPTGDFAEARAVFFQGGVIAYPTETFYGLGVDPFNVKAIEKLFSLKGRSEKNPISVIIKDLSQLKLVASEIPPAADALMKRFWPGPLTIVFKSKAEVPRRLVADTGKIGARVSSNAVANRLLEAVGSPLTATSANPSGQTPPVEPRQVLERFNGSIDILIDGGRLHGIAGSTVVDITGKEPLIVRQGEIPAELIFETIGK